MPLEFQAGRNRGRKSKKIKLISPGSLLSSLVYSKACLLCVLFKTLVFPFTGSCKNYSEPVGILSIDLPAASAGAPHYRIISPGFKGDAIFKGLVASISENNITFDKSTDLSNPFLKVGPFTPGMLVSEQARARAVIDNNGSIISTNLVNQGDGYLNSPKVFISQPIVGSDNSSETEGAFAETVVESGKVTSVITTYSGTGYSQAPTISIDGGPHFVRVTGNNSLFQGLCFKILENNDTTLKLENLSHLPFSDIFSEGTEVEVFRAWTVGSLLGYEQTQLASDENSSIADWIHLAMPLDQQAENSSFIALFHDGNSWKSVNDPSSDHSDRTIYPDESLIIARRVEETLSLQLGGNVLLDSSFWRLPRRGKQILASNPYPINVMLSDLIGPTVMTDQNSTEFGHLWYTHRNPDFADNIKILSGSNWSTYWHDGSNLGITQKAKISARKGSGIGGRLTTSDFSFDSGTITNVQISEESQNAIITSNGHGLKKGFPVTISDVKGYRINENNQRIDSEGNPVTTGNGFIVYSAINGTREVTNITSNTFELIGSTLDCEFLNDGNATWSTGFRGEGYDRNVTLSILGGGGVGALATGIVENGGIVSISLRSGGFSYLDSPEVVVHAGGWKSILAGSLPIGTLIVPPGSGALIIRNHPNGIDSMIPLSSLNDE